MKGNERNKLCPCGSGVKTKKCKALHKEDYDEAYRMNQEFDYIRDFYATRKHKMPTALAILAMIH